MEVMPTSKLAVSVPVIADFQGALSRCATQEMDLETITFVSSSKPAVGASVWGVLYFSRNVAYLPWAGKVTTVEKLNADSTPQFRIEVAFLPAKPPAREILSSALEALRNPLQAYDTSTLQTRNIGGTMLTMSTSPSILSFFITDNPYQLPYRPLTDFVQHVTSLRSIEAPSHSLPSMVQIPTTTTFSENGSHQFSLTMLSGSFGLCAQVIRDLAIRVLPASLTRLFITPIAFAFIGHPRTLDDVHRKFPLARFIPRRLVELWIRYQWPIVGSYITGLQSTDGTPTTGAMLFSPLTTEQMLRNPRLARQRVLETVQLAEKMGARIAGLGAFTSIVTRDGQDIAKKVRLGLTTGNPHSAAVAVQNVLHAATLTNLSLPHATAVIIGGAGSVGSACAKLLAPLVEKLLIVDIKKDALHNLVATLSKTAPRVEGMTTLDRVREADIVIAVTNNPHILVTANHLKLGAIVIDAAQPKNVSEEIPKFRPDVIVIESAIVQTPDVDVHFDLGLGPKEALGCLSETMILAATGWQGHYSLGKADPAHASHIIAAGRSLGFQLAPFRNSQGPITDKHLLRTAQSRIAHSTT